MAWYRAGTVAVTNGSAAVTGTNTAFVDNVQAGHAINLPDGRAYEVLNVVSNTQLTLGSSYLGGSATGQAYSVQPNQGFAQTAATRLSDFLTQVTGWVSGALAGRFGDGSSASPGIAFAGDQDTGLRRVGDNILAVVAGGNDRLMVDGAGPYLNWSGSAGFIGTRVADGSSYRMGMSYDTDNRILFYDARTGDNSGTHAWRTRALVEQMRLTQDGSLLVGVTTGNSHILQKSVAREAGNQILSILGQDGYPSGVFYSVSGNTVGNSAQAAFKLAHSTTTNRSLNASGTINASGADYAEYMTKADGCGTIAKGDVCGIDGDGKLTRNWAAAISFAVKSTDPAYVGGDIWSAHLQPKPVDPGAPPAAPAAPGAIPGDGDDAIAAWQAAVEAYPALVGSHQAALAAWQAAKAAYDVDLPLWEAALEAARQTVDRIAFAGQVPVNIEGEFAVGDYLIAASNGGGIHAVAVAEADITFAQYRRRLGKVWAIRGGRPWIDVQHG